MAKELLKICAGPVHARDQTWFTELSDKHMFFLEYLLSMEYLVIQQEVPKCTCIGAQGLWWQP